MGTGMKAWSKYRIGCAAVGVVATAWAFVPGLVWRGGGDLSPTEGGLVFGGLSLLCVGVVWRRLWVYPLLMSAAPAVFGVTAVLHNGFYALAVVTQDWPMVSGAVTAASVGAFLVAVLLCPAMLLAGLFGSGLYAAQRYRKARSRVGRFVCGVLAVVCEGTLIAAAILLVRWMA